MPPSTVPPWREQSRAEEIANAISHGLGFIAALGGVPLLITSAARTGDPLFIVGVSVFSASILLLYLASALYHAFPIGKAKQILKVFDHSLIFLLIAGTYAPFTLGVLQGAWGWSLFGVVWGLALAGVALKSWGRASHPVLFTCLYLLMGWMIVLAAKPLIQNVPQRGLALLLAGGLFYTVGTVFFATESRIRYGHTIWHFFVIGGTVCHYFAVLWFAN